MYEYFYGLDYVRVSGGLVPLRVARTPLRDSLAAV